MPRVLLLLPTTTYRAAAFIAAGHRLGVDVTVGSDHENALAQANPAGFVTVDFDRPDVAADQAGHFVHDYRVDAVVPADSRALLAAAAICDRLGMPSQTFTAAAAAGNKYLMRQRLAAAGVAGPRFQLGSFAQDLPTLAAGAEYPCVVKPLALSASQGVMRADDPQQCLAAIARLERILHGTAGRAPDNADAAARDAHSSEHHDRGPISSPSPRDSFLVEQYVDGPEFAVEGLLCQGTLHVLALLDKPDPLDGPCFEETILVTPSRLEAGHQQAMGRCAQHAAAALGLTDGPIHAELRLAAGAPSLIELNARSIGGLCSRVLRFAGGMSLEDVIIQQALDPSFVPPARDPQPSGVMMIPTPRQGKLRAVRGLDQARAVPAVDDVVLTVHEGQQLTPLPEGGRYLGFIFARASSVDAVEAALRTSHAELEFVVEG